MASIPNMYQLLQSNQQPMQQAMWNNINQPISQQSNIWNQSNPSLNTNLAFGGGPQDAYNSYQQQQNIIRSVQNQIIPNPPTPQPHNFGSNPNQVAQGLLAPAMQAANQQPYQFTQPQAQQPSVAPATSSAASGATQAVAAPSTPQGSNPNSPWGTFY